VLLRLLLHRTRPRRRRRPRTVHHVAVPAASTPPVVAFRDCSFGGLDAFAAVHSRVVSLPALFAVACCAVEPTAWYRRCPTPRSFVCRTAQHAMRARVAMSLTAQLFDIRYIHTFVCGDPVGWSKT